METSIGEQGLSLLCFLALGLMLGLCYDLLRPLRYGLKKAALWDGLFCALAAAGCFCLAVEKGRLGVWDIALSLAAFCMYINGLSRYVFPWISRFFGLFKTFVRFLEKKYFFCKKHFSNRNN